MAGVACSPHLVFPIIGPSCLCQRGISPSTVQSSSPVTIIKLFESILKIKLEKLLNLNLPPFKTAIKLDGNLTVKTFIEKETIAKIILKIQELYAK